MQLCIVTSSYAFDCDDGAAAAGVFVRDFAEAVAEQGQHVTVLTQCKEEGKEDSNCTGTDREVAVRTFAWSGGGRPLSSLRISRPTDAWMMWGCMRSGSRALAELHAEKNIDHVLAMWAVPAGVWARQLKRRAGVPYSVWCLGSDIWTYARLPLLRRVVRGVLRDADQLFADGLELAEEAGKLAGRKVKFLASSRRLGRERSDCEFANTDAKIQTPPAPPLPRGGNERTALLLAAAARPRFLFIGRYEPVKGVDVLLEAMALYATRQPHGHLYLVGGGSLEATIQERVKQPDLRGRVTVGGYADEATIIEYVTACDVVVIPSRMESIPVVLSDAVQLGRPVIATDVGDMGRLLRETPAGVVVPPDNPQAMCMALEAMVNRGASEFARPCADLAQMFDLGRVAERWLQAIE